MEWWNTGPVALMINSLVALSSYLFGSLGLTIIILTIIIRSMMYPLTAKQLHSTRRMQEIQPKIAELQKKYAKDKQRLAQEQMKLYKESGMSPAGCGVPMLIQMPIWIALYQSIIRLLAVVPEDFLNLSRYLWSVSYTHLRAHETRHELVCRLLLEKMFGFLAMSFPSGLALYWLVSNVITMVMQYFILGGWGGLARSTAGKYVVRSSEDVRLRVAEAEETPTSIPAMEADIVMPDSTPQQGAGGGELGARNQLRGGSYPASLRSVRRQSRRSKGHHPKRR